MTTWQQASHRRHDGDGGTVLWGTPAYQLLLRGISMPFDHRYFRYDGDEGSQPQQTRNYEAAEPGSSARQVHGGSNIEGAFGRRNK